MIYVPTLKSKMGELKALSKLSTTDKKQVVPLLEIPEIAWDFIGEKPSRTVKKHISVVAELIEKHWKELPFFLDFLPKIEVSSESNKSAFELFISTPEAANLKFTPVIGFERSELYLNQAIKYGKEKKTGLCIRAQYDDFNDVRDEDAYVNFLKKYDLDPKNIDLVIDLASVCKERSKTMYLALRLILSMIPDIEKWRNLIVIASSFPENLRGQETGSVNTLPRVEWNAWKEMNLKKSRLPKLPIFGDYSIANPDFNEVDPRIINMSAAIRYSFDDKWVIFKGKGIRMEGFNQFKTLSSELVASTYYSGSEFSEGDKSIFKYATEQNSGTGNATTWREIGNNHHITLVLSQLRELSK